MALIDILADGLDKNEILDRAHWRQLLMRDEASAVQGGTALVDEATRLGGTPVFTDTQAL